MADPAIAKLSIELRQLAIAMRQQTTVTKAALQQCYTIDDLQARYRRGRDAVLALLHEYHLYPDNAGPGRAILIGLDQVLLLDDLIAGRLDPATVQALRHPPVRPKTSEPTALAAG